MAKTCAHTKTYASVAAMANLETHNTREWTEDHPAPRYLLPKEHWDPRGNISIKTDLTPEKVIQEYLETNRFGKKHGKLQHRARPLRETVVVCEARHSREDLEKLMSELERQLPWRNMYGYLHRDEGYVADEKNGIVKHNWHMHIGHTNLIDGELVNPGKTGLRKLQDICAEVLGMERGTPAELLGVKRPHLNPREYRRMAREQERAVAAERKNTATVEQSTRELSRNLDWRNVEYAALKHTNQVLSAENVRLKEARKADEQALERLKNDPDLNLKPGLDTAVTLATRLATTNRQLRQALQDSRQATQENYKTLAAIKNSKLPISEKLVEMAEYVDRVTGDTSFSKMAREHREAMDVVLENDTKLKAEQEVLVTTNRELREALKASQSAVQGDYMELARIKKSDLSLDQKLYQMVQHVVKVTGNTALNDVAREVMNSRATLEQNSRPYLDAIQGIPEEGVLELNTRVEAFGRMMRGETAAAQSPAPAGKGSAPTGKSRRGRAGESSHRAERGSSARMKTWEELEEEARANRRGYRVPGA